ncbi:hypothetical protein EDC27_0029 [Desulfosoma caldarium]|uniref:Uncharacterized protein n=1 Tax=Desulfosoma caldarium TaxID=610254 RepID=A0A3N1VUN6_9BACT|nr:hypothetical protein EDC27_0029 [Desulfosoma caldarium]
MTQVLFGNDFLSDDNGDVRRTSHLRVRKELPCDARRALIAHLLDGQHGHVHLGCGDEDLSAVAKKRVVDDVVLFTGNLGVFAVSQSCSPQHVVVWVVNIRSQGGLRGHEGHARSGRMKSESQLAWL